MRKLNRKTLTLTAIFAGLFMLFATTAAFAAGSVEERLEVEIPFNFMVEDDALPAGTYVIYVADEDKPEVMRIESLDGEENVAFFTKAINAPYTGNTADSKSAVIFHKWNDTQHLSEVWIPQHSSGRLVVPANTEEHVAQQKDLQRTVINGTPSK